MNIKIPEFALVVLIGPSGSGKSTFARDHFKPTEVLSSDFCRGLVSDDENSLNATKDAFEVLRFIADKRLENMRLTVIDATNVQQQARKPLLALAREYHCLPVAIVLNMPERLCQERNKQRENRSFGPHVIRNHRRDLRRSLKGLKREGFRFVYELKTPEEVEAVNIERTRLWTNRRDEHGPFDIIGDLHGCATELEMLLHKLGYKAPKGTRSYAHPEGRKAIFLGDLVDRGPRNLDVYRIVRAMMEQGTALCIPGNHDVKLLRKLRGKNVKVAFGLEKTLAELEALPEDERHVFEQEMATFLDGLVSHYVLNEDKLVVAHAGMKEVLQGRASGRVREFALYGETTGETDKFGLPVRYNWAAEYRGKPMVVYGHTPVPQAEWLNRTINIDTGCVFGGKLTALRYPELELVDVPAQQVYADPVKPFLSDTEGKSPRIAQHVHDDVLYLDDVQGKRFISTRLRENITIREENAAAALEVMSRFAVNPKWLIYLPPTMSPPAASDAPGLLEHPGEAFEYYRGVEVLKVICEEKHMGSRAIVIVCRNKEVASKRFGITTKETGVIYTRTGRRFFDDVKLNEALLDRLRTAMDRSDFWKRLETDWVCLDCELMPWSAKAQELIRHQYAAVGAASGASLPQAIAALEKAATQGVPVNKILERYTSRFTTIGKYVKAYQHYCWPVSSVEDLKLAPFHVLATEGKVHVDKDHLWHMESLQELVRTDDGVLHKTATKVVNLNDPVSEKIGVDWWEEMTGRGGEGMVVKPLNFVAYGRRGIAQPAIKCRGREYLRIIYSPEYTAPEHLERLRQRNVGRKRSLALREFALGIEALERFVRGEPLRRVHECVFGILALESEPVDPRL